MCVHSLKCSLQSIFINNALNPLFLIQYRSLPHASTHTKQQNIHYGQPIQVATAVDERRAVKALARGAPTAAVMPHVQHHSFGTTGTTTTTASSTSIKQQMTTEQEKQERLKVSRVCLMSVLCEFAFSFNEHRQLCVLGSLAQDWPLGWI